MERRKLDAVPERPPAPLEWHPAYRDRPGLIDWLNGDTSRFRSDCIRIPLSLSPRIARIVTADELPAFEPIRLVTLTKRRACGVAPYVGRPFVYEWMFATDEWGRSIAGESHIRYTAVETA